MSDQTCLSERVTQLKTEHKTLSIEVETLKNQKRQISKDWNAIVNDLPKKKKELSEIEDRLPGVKQKFDDLQKQILELTPKAKALNEEIAKLQPELVENAEKVAQLREVDKNIKALQARKDSLIDQVTLLELKVKTLKKKEIDKPLTQTSLFYCARCVQTAFRDLSQKNPEATIWLGELQKNVPRLCHWTQHPGVSNQVDSGYDVFLRSSFF